MLSRFVEECGFAIDGGELRCISLRSSVGAHRTAIELNVNLFANIATYRVDGSSAKKS